MNTSLYIKNMVCPRCISAVEQLLNKFNIPFSEVKLGEVVLEAEKSEIDIELLDKELKEIGFELLNDKKSNIINQIKTAIINYIHHSEDLIRKENYSDYLKNKLGLEYSYLSKLFSSVEAQTIEKYIILQKTEKVKELLIYDELSLSEISYQLDYSSVQHLSRQFKRITGMTPSAFKNSDNRKRNTLDKL